jgi:Tfp pilus assembly protein PilX
MKKSRKNRKDQGSALLVSLMVMVGLSLLGLAFVAISETESAISINERNYAQTLHVAEAGAKTVAQWFNDPLWAEENGLMPLNNTTAFKQQRQNNAISSGSSEEYYKFAATTKLCDIPYNKLEDKFYGADENSADININYTNSSTFLNQFNTRLLNDVNEGGRVVNIRIYGPPVVAGTTTTVSGRKYWNTDIGTRYGLATIAVTAEKTKDGSLTGQVIARRTYSIYESKDSM